MLQEDLMAFLEEKTNLFQINHPSDQFTANVMAERFQVKRNTISHYLNKMVEEGKVIKINTRPVYFLSRAVFEKQFFPVSTCIFDSLDSIQEQMKEATYEVDLFDQLVGADGSMKKAIEQIKSSVHYPGSGLPLILCGPTGVGKSYTASLIYQYSVEKGILSKDAPFISFNCAQYANNPELLSSNLFGHIKGAFTGADQTTRGMLEAADGGILFLDEVHRLNEEGQEKLFTFLDQGVYRRMGETDGWHHAKVRIIFATTIDLKGNFLETFLRRIPIRITIPSWEQWENREKRQLVYMFLIQEARKINMPIQITNIALDALTNHNYSGNLGGLKNTLKYLVASSFVKDTESNHVSITLHDLPDKILKETIQPTDYKFKQNSEIIIEPSTTLNQLFTSPMSRTDDIKKTYKEILHLFQDVQKQKLDQKALEKHVFNEITALFDRFIFKTKKNTGLMMEVITVNVQEIIRYLESTNNIKFNGNSVFTMAHFLYYKGNSVIEWSDEQKKIINQMEQYVAEKYQAERQLVSQFIELLNNKLDVHMSKMDKSILTFYLRSLSIEPINEQRIRAVILAHGYATASSIANVANRLLHTNIFEAFDMPLDISVEDIARQVLHYVEYTDVSKGLVILVDMGSLKDIHSQLIKYIHGPIAIINNVSTQMALFVGELLEKGSFLEEMVEKLKDVNETQYSIIYPEKKRDKVIVTSCFTGMGTALQIQKLLEASIPADLEIKIIAHDYSRLEEFGYTDALFQLYDVLAIVGTTDPGIREVDYISLEDLISGHGEEKLWKIFRSVISDDQIETINNNLLRNFSIEQVIESITILDTDKILTHVEEFLNRLEMLMNKRLTNDKKVALYVHTSCLVERLIRQTPMETYHNIDDFVECQRNTIEMIREAFSVIESVYSVKITTAEIGYIYDYIVSESTTEGAL
ncbi:sigma 54-interacting transcriptional regulator [Lederbergia sp. NSJ-179]|uniref:sigma 54-interacting transcriptional regulator n=1 Tax=Lederbergia sp. NSJ-179 TaxID=2931402 RepID=UPI001FD3D386|nr:sigma-54-dependent transcriptional regulator [Lederbergia sp. NSJ-179]MCJ7842976.1 sigma 54-interacting transcriptional regulator [Lederbergia sp. NSJ-179]